MARKNKPISRWLCLHHSGSDSVTVINASRDGNFNTNPSDGGGIVSVCQASERVLVLCTIETSALGTGKEGPCPENQEYRERKNESMLKNRKLPPGFAIQGPLGPLSDACYSLG